MAAERYVVLGLAHVRSGWFQEVSRWATSAAIAVDFVKAVSVEEVRARLGSGRAFSALLVDGSLPGVDRDLLDRAHEVGAAVIVVEAPRAERDWLGLGAAAVLAHDFGRDELRRVLEDHANPVGRSDELPGEAERGADVVTGFRGSTVAVTGSGGAGTSTVAIALAQGLACREHLRDFVVLADLDLDADQAMLHDARDVVPGLLELVDAHRSSHPTAEEVRRLAFAVLERRYHLLLGLRRHRDWTALRPRAFEAALDALARSYRVVVADVAPDVEGEDECGSLDVEERNLVSRTTLRAADAVVVAGRAGMQGLHAQLRVLRDLLGLGVAAERLVPLVNRAPRTVRARAELTRSFAELLAASRSGPEVAPPVFVPERRRLEEALRDGVALPDAVVGPVTGAVTAALDRAGPSERTGAGGIDAEPVPVTPGSLGAWYDEEASG